MADPLSPPPERGSGTTDECERWCERAGQRLYQEVEGDRSWDDLSEFDRRRYREYADALWPLVTERASAPLPEEPSEAAVKAAVDAEDGTIGFERARWMLRAAYAVDRADRGSVESRDPREEGA